jgi:hypothetical protein
MAKRRAKEHTQALKLTFALALIASFIPIHAQVPKDISIPMEPARWELDPQGSGEFVRHRGVAALKIANPTKAILKDLVFRDGTIEFDMEPGTFGGPGIGFRRSAPGEYEYFYLRPAAKSPQSGDACQYAPYIKNVLIWDLLPRWQGPAPFRLNEWNHIRIVVSGARAQIFVNDSGSARKPVLDIGRLESNAKQGGILMNGPAVFANLHIRPGVTNGLPAQPINEPEDRRILKRWEVAPAINLAPGQEPGVGDIPPATATAWKPVVPERDGLINLTRLYGLPEGRSLTWLRTSVDRKEPAGVVQVAVGYSEEIWVFVNGKQVFTDKNRYLIPSERKAPDGRCAATNGQFSLPLKQGRNEIQVAVANGFYGWGLIFQILGAR